MVSDGRLPRGVHGDASEATAFAVLEGVQGAVGPGSQTTTWVRDDAASGVLLGRIR
ncbi:hypothetical protein ADILRU_1592 [Leifsonia rubra CMS 76R]|nr:hypothetical protein ADILRU_1592 [Leifsonia rubra CMS 76R]